MNPVKAGMVTKPADYTWSSYSRNALAMADDLITDQKLYKALGKGFDQRCAAYKALFGKLDISGQDSQITRATFRGEVFGNDRFHKRISRLIERPTKLSSHGGDRKSEAYVNQAG